MALSFRSTAGRLTELRQRAPDAADRLPDAVLVLDEREADVSIAAGAEADARADRDVRLADQLERELERAEAAVRLRNRRPDEHRPPRPRHLPAHAREPAAEG